MTYETVRNRILLVLTPWKEVGNEADLYLTTKKYINQVFEGSILKNPDGHYVCDRSNDWHTVKEFYTSDYEIVSSYEGSGRNEGRLGGFEVDVNGVRVGVGGGYSDTQRDKFWLNRSKMVGKIIEVKYQAITPDGSLRFPVFIRLRDDK